MRGKNGQEQRETETKAETSSAEKKQGEAVLYKGETGHIYTVSSETVGEGGEGVVYSLIGDNSKVAKIYKKTANMDEIIPKLKWMCGRHKQDSIAACTTWPEELLYKDEKICGYIMRRLSGGVSLPVFLGDDYEYIGWNIRVLTALNLAIAVDCIHSSGYVCGDLRSRNIYVDTKQFRVTIMDADSFHIRTQNPDALYRCRVGDPEYLAPEILTKFLAGKDLRQMEQSFTQETDLFALAINIFMLLMKGYHPFSARLLPEALDIDYVPKKFENIQEGKSYFFEKSRSYAPPLGAPSIQILPPKIREMFLWTFQIGHRVPKQRSTAREWKNALYQMKDSFARCGHGHYYYKELDKCPWCDGNIT